jgi:hypothetical protein
MEPPPGLQDLDLDALIGQPVDRAREIVEAAGGTLRAVAPGAALRLDYRPDRVTAIVVAGEVIEVRGIG